MSELEKTKDQRELLSSPFARGFYFFLFTPEKAPQHDWKEQSQGKALSGLGMTLVLERPRSPGCPGLKFFLVLFSEGKRSCVVCSRMNHSSKKGK